MSGDDALRELYLEWKTLRDRRRDAGGQRPDAAEVTAFERLLGVREELDDEEWDAMVAELESGDLNLCACGHHLALHHDRTGSCFQVVGCVTACPCEHATAKLRIEN